jgi:peptidoglycan hydrolase CwlO-like protein
MLAVKDRRQLRRRAAIAAAAGAVAIVTAIAAAVPSRADLSSRYAAGQKQAGALQSAIKGESSRIEGYRGTVGSLEGRLRAIQRSVDDQERLLVEVRSELVDARARLRNLEAQLAHDQQVLAAELRAEYESPPPTIMNVVVDAHGFDDLLNRVNQLRAIEQRNAQAMRTVRDQRRAVAAQTVRLSAIEARRRRSTAAVVIERDQVARLRLSIVDRELAVARERAANASRLHALKRTLARQAAALDRQAAAAAALSTGGAPAAPGGCASAPFIAHGGSFGFFPAAGTNYSVGEEPTIAARLDALGRTLQLHLDGISGYRSPQHSVAVGGFADDPHTRGEASDTPGVEGVPEATLERFCLTRPFGGAAEADHIQLH